MHLQKRYIKCFLVTLPTARGKQLLRKYGMQIREYARSIEKQFPFTKTLPSLTE